MGWGYKRIAFLYILNLVFIFILFPSLPDEVKVMEAYILIGLIFLTALALLVLKIVKNFFFGFSMLFFGLDLFHCLYLYTRLSTIGIVGLFLVNVAGFILSIEFISPPKERRPRIIKEMSPREKRQEIDKELGIVQEQGLDGDKVTNPEESEIADKKIAGDKIGLETYHDQKEKLSIVGATTSKKYHISSCRYAHMVKEENKRYFESAEEAEKAGYEPCKCILRKNGK